jgi:mono/diheme cytochrome c family protein
MNQPLLGACGVLFLSVAYVSTAFAGPPLDINSPAAVQQGQDLFNQTCSNCHGENGDGGPVVFQGRSDLTADKVFDTISNGRVRGATIMPAWKDSLSEADRWALTAFIVSQAAIARPR